MRKIKKCLLCGSRGEDVIFNFYCSNSKCKNYREDITPTIDYRDDDEQLPSYNWVFYDYDL